MSFVITQPKLVTETVTIPFDFESQLGISETITSQEVTVTVFQGLDAAPEDILVGAATVSGVTVMQQITAGTVGVVYLLNCAATTSESNDLIIQTYLAVISSNPFQA